MMLDDGFRFALHTFMIVSILNMERLIQKVIAPLPHCIILGEKESEKEHSVAAFYAMAKLLQSKQDVAKFRLVNL